MKVAGSVVFGETFVTFVDRPARGRMSRAQAPENACTPIDAGKFVTGMGRILQDGRV